MNLIEFNLKPITTKLDGVAVVSDVPFPEDCAYVKDGPDTKVANLLAGFWLAKQHFTKCQIVEVAVCALFPNKGYMRRTTSSSALMLAKAFDCHRDLQNAMMERWVSIHERGCNEVVLGLSDTDDVDIWLPSIQVLFRTNDNVDVRSQLVKATSNMFRAKDSQGAKTLLIELLAQMPTQAKQYSNPNNFEFISKLHERFLR